MLAERALLRTRVNVFIRHLVLIVVACLYWSLRSSFHFDCTLLLSESQLQTWLSSRIRNCATVSTAYQGTCIFWTGWSPD